MQLRIDKLVHGGAGLGSSEGKAIFVPFAAPGDVLEVEITADHGRHAEARIVRLIEPAPCRVSPRCPVFGICGGCQWQHLAYDAQLSWKREILAETIERIGRIAAPHVLPALAAPSPWHYRNRIQLHVDRQGRVGFYRPHTNEVVEFDSCAIAEDAVNRELTARRAEIARRDRGIALKSGEGEGFVQVNTAQNERLQTLVAGWLAEVPHEEVVELYAGSGNFTFAIAKVAGRVFASDIDGRAVRAAQERQASQGICNVQFRCLPAERALRGHVHCDALFLDPPRKGAAEAIFAIVAAGPAAILYLSCDPATLARDLRAFADAGYRLERCQPIDMFPQTFHIESLSLLRRVERQPAAPVSPGP
jgi:23S rRNA (uracil1939-C5)-methyltransferase